VLEAALAGARTIIGAGEGRDGHGRDRHAPARRLVGPHAAEQLVSGSVRHGNVAHQNVHVEAPGWGRDNVLTGNSGDLGADGEYGVRVDNDARGTRVGCDNRVSGAGKGLSNIPCR